MTTEEALQQAMLHGLRSAYELLETDRADVAVENQTWDSAVAKLKLFELSLRQSFDK